MNNQDFFISYACLIDTYRLSGYPLKVISLLIKATNHETKGSYMSKSTLASKCKCSVSTITRALRKLEQENLVACVACKHDRKKPTIKRQSSNDYYVNFSIIEAAGLKLKASGDCVSLSGSELVVYNFIATRVGNRDSFALSRREIALKCNLSTSTVYYAITKLEKNNLICVKRDKINEVSQVNVFSLIYKKRSEIMENVRTNSSLLDNTKKLSPNATTLFNYIKSCEYYDAFCTENKLSKKSGVFFRELDTAINELEHYQLLTRWYSDPMRKPRKWHFTLSALFTIEDFPNALPPLPIDVANGEPFITSFKNTVFSVPQATPTDVKLYSTLRYLLQPKDTTSSMEAFETSKLKQPDFAASLSKLIDAGYFIENSDTIAFGDVPVPKWPIFSSNQYFNLSPTQFTVIVFLDIISEDKRKVFITSQSISEYCNIPKTTVSGIIKQLVNKGLIKSSLFSYLYRGTAGRIIELVDKNDTGG